MPWPVPFQWSDAGSVMGWPSWRMGGEALESSQGLQEGSFYSAVLVGSHKDGSIRTLS